MVLRSVGLALLVAILVPAFASGPTPPADAGTPIQVTKQEDTNDGTCDADCSLREAIIAANAAPSADAINLGAGTYTLTLAGGSEDLSATGDLDIVADVAITGAGVGQTTIDAAGLDRAFHVASAVEVTMTSLTISGGQEDVAGAGGILNHGDLTVRASRLADNGAIAGGAISNYGTLAVRTSTIDANHAQFGPGGIFNADEATATIEGSTISHNTVADPGHAGGGILNHGEITIVNSTLSGNSAGGGGAIINGGEGQAAFSSSTIAFNGGSDAVRTVGSSTTLVNTIVANNNGAQCLAGGGSTLISSGNNLASDDTCNLTGPGDKPNTDAFLAPLADNGGPTFTHALLPASPAINAGNQTECPDTDQRGQLRVGGCDIGAFEFAVVPTWGDVDCDGALTTRDNQAELRFVLQQNALSQTEPCPDIGTSAVVNGSALVWGDEDCDGAVTTRDNQSKLRFVLQQNPLGQTEPCPDVGTAIEVEG